MDAKRERGGEAGGGGRGSGMEWGWEFGVSRCKLLNLEWTSTEILLYRTISSRL